MDFKSSDGYKTLLLEFIDLYKSLPCLWNRQHRGYALKHHRLEAYKQMLHKYREIDEDATLHTVKNRLGHIRCGFIRELKKVRLSQEMTSDPSLQYQPSLWYYNSCTFLMDQYCPVKYSETNKMKESDYKNDEQQECRMEYLDDSQTEVEYLEESSNSSIDQDDSLSRKRKKVMVKSENSEHCSIQLSDNETECIAKAFAVQMRGLDPYQSVIANKLISDTIFYARLGKLTANAYVVPGDTVHGSEDHYP